MSIRVKNLEKRLLEFNINENDAIEGFKNIVDNLRPEDRKALGQKYEIWKLGCLYHFITCPGFKTNIGPETSRIIHKYQQTESEISKQTNSKELLSLLHSAANTNPSHIHVMVQ